MDIPKVDKKSLIFTNVINTVDLMMIDRLYKRSGGVWECHVCSPSFSKKTEDEPHMLAPDGPETEGAQEDAILVLSRFSALRIVYGGGLRRIPSAR